MRKKTRHWLNKKLAPRIKIKKIRDIKPINYKRIPIYVIVFNQLSYLARLVDFLEACGYENIHLIDNHSSYPPLLEYLSKTKHTVHRMDKNYGHMVFWKSGKFEPIINSEYYVVTDPDILPTEECPADFLDVFYRLLQCAPRANKIGFALKIDDLPDSYQNKGNVLEWESAFWKRRVKNSLGLDIFEAEVDTTFALYKPKKERKVKKGLFCSNALRVGGQYSARHLPWYQCHDTPEQEFYKKTSNVSASWLHQTNKAFNKK